MLSQDHSQEPTPAPGENYRNCWQSLVKRYLLAAKPVNEDINVESIAETIGKNAAARVKIDGFATGSNFIGLRGQKNYFSPFPPPDPNFYWSHTDHPSGCSINKSINVS